MTDYIIGLVIYTGHDTKIMKNSPSVKSKTSRVEDTMNSQILLVFLFQISLSVFATVTSTIFKNNDLVIYFILTIKILEFCCSIYLSGL